MPIEDNPADALQRLIEAESNVAREKLQARVAELDARLERLMGPPPDKTKLRVNLIAAGISEKTADEILSSPTFNRAALEGKKDE